MDLWSLSARRPAASGAHTYNGPRHTGSVRRLVWLFAIPALAACGIGTCRLSYPPIDVAQSEPLLLGVRADGVEVECRGLPLARCESLGQSEIPAGLGFDVVDVDRLVASCASQCGQDNGEMRLDAVHGDEATLIANGGYGQFQQSCQ